MSPEERLAAKIRVAAERFPEVELALRQERAALEVASAMAEIMETTELSVEALALKSGVPAAEIEAILAATTEGRTSIASLANIAAAAGYRFGFSFAPKTMSIAASLSYVVSDRHVVGEYAPDVPGMHD